MEEKLVSIITPCYNGESYLERFFHNILEQTYKNIELIFINDGSTDKTEKIALKYKNIFESQNMRLNYIYQENSGQAAAVNKGIKIFTGDYLIWTDADDILDKNNIRKKVEFFVEHPEFEFAQCYGSIVNEENLNNKVKWFGRIPPVGRDNFFEDLIMKRNVEYTPGIYIVTRKAFLKANPLRDIFESRIGQNYQMLLPIAYNFKCGYINEDLFKYVIRSNSHSRESIKVGEFIRRTYKAKILLLETLDRIDIQNREYYKNKVDERTIRDLFYAGIAFRDDKLLKESYCKLKNKDYITVKDHIQFWSYRSVVVRNIFEAAKAIKKIIQKFIRILRM